MSNILEWNIMKNKTLKFYNELGIEVNPNLIKIAAQSLTMPSYANEYNQVNTDSKIKDHRSLATVGDAICEALLMIRKYNGHATMNSLTKKKGALTNENLNIVGKQLLEEHLFNSNNDLDPNNKKSYATAFEAIIGFLSLISIDKAKMVFDRYIK